jgi:ATP-dependent exoDNAse (exonuclease V) alpha subunit
MNAKQQECYDEFFKKKNIFLTGTGGTGKSYVLNQITTSAAAKKLKIGITATTGAAAVLVNGRTINSFLGIGLAKSSPQTLANISMKKNKKVVQTIKKLDVLIIEEISMMDMDLFEKVSDYLSIIRGNPKPFGNLQILLCGDFMQLCPVSCRGWDKKYCFKSSVWSGMNFTNIILTENIRQNSDIKLQQVLEKVRWGECDKETLEYIRNLRIKDTNSSIKPTILHGKNAEVDAINEAELAKMIASGAKTSTYNTIYHHKSSEKFAASSKIPEKVTLCIGCQVIVTWNIRQDIGIINGTRGVVIDFTQSGVLIQLKSGKQFVVEYVSIKQDDYVDANTFITYMPLKLAWSISIHKSQGATLDCAEMDLGSSIFEYGQAFTSLSRIRDSSSVTVLDVEASSFKCHEDVKEFYKSIGSGPKPSENEN